MHAPRNKSTATLQKMKTSPVSTWREFVALTKPGIIRGNLLSATAGFLLASNRHFDAVGLIAMLIGTSCIIAAACVCNNILDRRIDIAMERTRHRALVEGRISVRAALIFALLLFIVGVAALLMGTNVTTCAIGLIGFVAYVALYGYAKRNSVYGTHIGSISGATPPIAGYVAAHGSIDTVAVVLFVIMLFWQMPHFFAIALYRKSDYAAASIPTMPVLQPTDVAKRRILGYVVAYGICSLLLPFVITMSPLYGVGMAILIVYWLWMGLHKLRGASSVQWGKRMFLFSLIVLLTQSLLISINPLLT